MSSTDPKIYIFQSELKAIAKEASKYNNKETGGDLYGLWSHGNRPIIFLATGPGPNARGEYAEFQQDHTYIMQCEEYLYKKFGIQYLGDWHSHHNMNLPRPSTGDVDRIRRYASKTGRDRLVEIIVTHTQQQIEQIEQINTYLYIDVPRKAEPIAVELLKLEESESPIRDKVTNNKNTSILNCTDEWKSFPGERIITSTNQPTVNISKNTNQDLEKKLRERLGKYTNQEYTNQEHTYQEINNQTMMICVFIKHRKCNRIYFQLENVSLKIIDVLVLNEQENKQKSLKENLDLRSLNQKPKSLEATIEEIIFHKLINT
jgi:hypothetical protein